MRIRASPHTGGRSAFGCPLAAVAAFVMLVFGTFCAIVSADDGAASASTSADGRLIVEVLDIKSDKGQVGCSLFTRAEGFPGDSDKAARSMFVEPKGRKASCVFENVKPGTYAVSVMQDLDEDGELERSMVGRPKEPWGVSNNVPAERFGPPKFKAASFKYSGKEAKLQVGLHD